MNRENFQTISHEQAKHMMEQQPVTILDVREPSEYASGHIEGAQNLPLGSVRRTAASELPDLDTVLLVYCRSGARAATACAILSDLGYQHIYNFGGIVQWPYEITSET